MVSVKKYAHDGNLNSFSIELSEPLKEQIVQMETQWNVRILENMPVFQNAGYTMSPELGDLIRKKIYPDVLSKFEEVSGIKVEQIDNKVMNVLYRVTIWDTYQLISRNAKIATSLLNDNYGKRGFLRLRWICTGAGVAERTIISMLHRSGVKDIRGTTTDISAAAIILATINLEIMNVILGSSFVNRIVFKDIPHDLEIQPNTIILQIDDAISSTEKEVDIINGNEDLKYDAYLADNALPYFGREDSKKLLASSVKITTKNAVFQALGLNENMKVVIPLTTKIAEIFRKDIVKEFNEILGDKKYPNDYRHKYVYKNGIVVRVISEGAAQTFGWLKKMLFSFEIGRFLKFMKMISIGTSLSKWGRFVYTNTADSYKDLLELLNDRQVEIFDDPGEEEEWRDMVLSTFTVKLK